MEGGSTKYLNVTGLMDYHWGGLTQILFKIVMDKSFSLFSDGFKDGRL